MSFNELLDITPNVTLADIIQLFLLGYDDKVYLNLANSEYDYVLVDERIISDKFSPYYTRKVAYLMEETGEDGLAYLTVVLKR